MRTLFVVLACLTSLALNCQNINKGDYLAVTKTQGGMKELEKKLAPYGVKEFKFIGKNILKIELERDPGLVKVKKIASTCSNISSIEPNRVVKINPPVEKNAKVK